MKKIFVKTIFAAVAIALSAFLLVTCDLLSPPNVKESEVDYLDWQYVEQPDGGGKLTLMLDGSTPFAHPRLNQRALSVEMAKMAHDYFEVVFVAGATMGTDDPPDNLPTHAVLGGTSVARASWQIGEPAGISGVSRGRDYGKVFPAAGEDASVIFVGKKTGKTLLGIGHLIEVKEGNTSVTAPTALTITQAATSVTFGVYPFKTNIGWYDDDGDSSASPPPSTITPEILRGTSTDTDEKLRYPDVTFMTATTAKDNASGANLTGPDEDKTIGGNISLRGGVAFPLYTLPDVTYHNRTIEALYKISGMAGTGSDPGQFSAIPKPNLLDSARIIGTVISTGNIGIEIIKRVPSYITGGQTFDAQGDIDMLTKVEPLTTATTEVPTLHGYDEAHKAFGDTIGMKFTQIKDASGESSGIFAITFQCPVYAITQATATNSGPAADKWYIRPGYQQYQYLLDNGKDAGGMVMLGTNAGDIDWLDIFTVGIGFSN